MGGDDFQELQTCRQTIDQLQERAQRLERINNELEYRLEDQAKQCMAAEKDCLDIRAEWALRCDQLAKEIENWKREFTSQQLNSDRLRDHLSRTEGELYVIIQRKHENSGFGRSGIPQRRSSNDSGTLNGESVNEAFLAPQTQSRETRQKRVISSLMDFCGL
jgi:chromosome segregation ATPase